MDQNDFNKCNTMEEILKVCMEKYDLTERLGFTTKIIVVNGINKVVKLIRAKEKENA